MIAFKLQSAAAAAQKQAQAELDELRESMHAAASEAVTQQAMLHLQLDEQSASTSQLAISLAAAEAEREEQDNQLQLVVHQVAAASLLLVQRDVRLHLFHATVVTQKREGRTRPSASLTLL